MRTKVAFNDLRDNLLIQTRVRLRDLPTAHRADNDVYHPVNAQLPDAAVTGGGAADGVGTGVVPIGTDLGYTQ